MNDAEFDRWCEPIAEGLTSLEALDHIIGPNKEGILMACPSWGMGYVAEPLPGTVPAIGATGYDSLD